MRALTGVPLKQLHHLVSGFGTCEQGWVCGACSGLSHPQNTRDVELSYPYPPVDFISLIQGNIQLLNPVVNFKHVLKTQSNINISSHTFFHQSHDRQWYNIMWFETCRLVKFSCSLVQSLGDEYKCRQAITETLGEVRPEVIAADGLTVWPRPTQTMPHC